MKVKRTNIVEKISQYRTELMGISIIWIMLFHSGIVAPDFKVFRIIWYLTVSFGGGIGVNIFLILSGFGLMCSWIKKNKNAKKESILEFYKRRFKRILPAYIIVSGIYYVLTFTDFGSFICNIIGLNFFVDGVRTFWYIYAILICYLFFPVYIKLQKKIGIYNSVTMTYVIIFVLVLFISCMFPIWYGKIEIMLWRFPYFLFGCFLGNMLEQKGNKGYILVLGGTTLIAFILYVMLYKSMSIQASVVERNLFGALSFWALLVFITILTLISKFTDYINRFLRYLGKRSLEIYLIHVSFGILILESISLNRYLLLTLYFLVSVILSEILYRVINLSVFCEGVEKNKF